MSSSIAHYVQGLVMKKRGLVFVITFSRLMTIIVNMGSFILAEKISLEGVLGAVLIVVGLYSVLWGKYKEKEAEEEEIPWPVKFSVVSSDHNGQSAPVMCHDVIEAANNINTIASSGVTVAVAGPIAPVVAVKAPKPNQKSLTNYPKGGRF